MANKEKNYTAIISELVKKQSFLDKTLLHNLLSHDCEQIFNLTCEIDVDNFIDLYGRQSFDYRVKQSNFWLGGENYYDNINNKSLGCSHEIVPINDSNIDKILYNRITIYASTIECDYLELKNLGFFQEWFNENVFTQKFYTQNKEYICNLINQTIKTNYVSFDKIEWNIVSASANIDILKLCVDYLDWESIIHNSNLTKEFILEHIRKFDIFNLITYQVVTCHPTWVADVMESLPVKIDEQRLTQSIIQITNELGWTIDDVDLLCAIDYIDWDTIFRNCYFDYDFVVKYNKYWNKDNKIVKSILENHTINTNKKYILVDSDLVVKFVGNTYEETFNYLREEIKKIYYYIETAESPLTINNIMERYMRNKFHFLDNDIKEDIVEFKITEIEIPHQKL